MREPLKQVDSHRIISVFSLYALDPGRAPARSSVLRVSELHHVVWQYWQYHHCMPPALSIQHEPVQNVRIMQTNSGECGGLLREYVGIRRAQSGPQGWHTTHSALH